MHLLKAQVFVSGPQIYTAKSFSVCTTGEDGIVNSDNKTM